MGPGHLRPTRSQDIQAALSQAAGTFGRLDIAFNNAGAEQQHAPLAGIPEDEWDQIIAINLRGVFLSMKYEIPLMPQHGGGAIVNPSSGAGVKAFGGGGSTRTCPVDLGGLFHLDGGCG